MYQLHSSQTSTFLVSEPVHRWHSPSPWLWTANKSMPFICQVQKIWWIFLGSAHAKLQKEWQERWQVTNSQCLQHIGILQAFLRVGIEVVLFLGPVRDRCPGGCWSHTVGMDSLDQWSELIPPQRSTGILIYQLDYKFSIQQDCFLEAHVPVPTNSTRHVMVFYRWILPMQKLLDEKHCAKLQHKYLGRTDLDQL